MNLKDRLKELCKSRNTTIAELEKALNFGSGTICKWGTSMPTSEKILAVADYFGVSVDYLLDRKTDTDDVEEYLQMIHLGVPDTYAMERGGWSSRQTLDTVYQHTLRQEVQAYDERINAYFESLLDS